MAKSLLSSSYFEALIFLNYFILLGVIKNAISPRKPKNILSFNWKFNCFIIGVKVIPYQNVLKISFGFDYSKFKVGFKYITKIKKLDKLAKFTI